MVVAGVRVPLGCSRHALHTRNAMSEPPTESLYEEKQIRCPKLGGPVTFSYCRVESTGRPCSRAINCWSAYFDAEGLFRSHMSPEQFAQCFFSPPKSKMSTILELIEQAKKASEKPQDKEP